MPHRRFDGYYCDVCGHIYDRESKAKECEARGRHKSFDYEIDDYVCIGYNDDRRIVKVTDIVEQTYSHSTTVHTINIRDWQDTWSDHDCFDNEPGGVFLHPLTMEELGQSVYLLRLLKNRKGCHYVPGAFFTFGERQNQELCYGVRWHEMHDNVLYYKEFDSNQTVPLRIPGRGRRMLYPPAVERTKRFVRAALKQVREHDGST